MACGTVRADIWTRLHITRIMGHDVVPMATHWTRFPKAPIKEAILDIRVELPAETDLEQLLQYEPLVKDRFPNKRERVRWEAQIDLNKDPTQSKQVDGRLYTSPDGKDMVQARLDGFTLNRLQPYDRWETFRDMGRELWELYVSIARPSTVTRIALRYINRLELPLPVGDFKDYILTGPEIAPSVSQALSGFFMRLEMPHDEYQAMAIITETMEPDDGKFLPFIFDIDVIRQEKFSPLAPQIWETFELLRDLKNHIFFNSLTDRTKELFK
jgi:uncharacterized protein (TIGR04255 family)